MNTNIITNTLDYDYDSVCTNEFNLLNQLNNMFPNNNILDCLLMFIVMAACRKDDNTVIMIMQLLNKNVHILLI